MGTTKVSNSLNKTLHLTGIGLAVQAFYINLTLDSVLGGEYLELRPVGPPIINPANILDVNGVPLAPYYYPNYDRRGVNRDVRRLGAGQSVVGTGLDQNAFRDQNGYYQDNAGLKNGYDVGRTYGGGKDYGVTGVDGSAFGDVNGRNKGHQVAGFSTNYQKNESGNKATYYDDGLGHGGVVQYGLRDHRYRDGAGNAYGGGVHDSSLKTNALGNQGQFGQAGGYRGSDNRGGTVANADLYRGGVGQGAIYDNGGFLAPPPVLSPAPILPPGPAPVFGAPGPALLPGQSYTGGFANRPALAPLPGPIPLLQLNGRAASNHNSYVIPLPDKLYYDKPGGK